jgi:hypothetical protein
VLANENGPFDAERLAIKTGLPQKIFKLAFEFADKSSDQLDSAGLNGMKICHSLQFCEILRGPQRLSARDSRDTARVSGQWTMLRQALTRETAENPRKCCADRRRKRADQQRMPALMPARDQSPTGQDTTGEDRRREDTIQRE